MITGLKWKKAIPRALNVQNKKALPIEELKEFVAAAKESDIYLPVLFDALMGLRRKDRKSTRLNSSHSDRSRMPSSA